MAHPSVCLVLLAWVTISLSQGLATRWHNTLNRISYWRALKSQIIHGGSSTIVLTVAFCSKDNSHTTQTQRKRHRQQFLAIVCQLSHCMWCESFCNAICGRVEHTTYLVTLVDVLTESCQSSKETFLIFLLTQCIAATTAADGVAAAAAATTSTLAKAGGDRRGGGGYCGGGCMCGGCCGAVQWGFLCEEKEKKNKQTNTLIARQHKFAHSARHASPFATAEPQCSNTLATPTTTRTKNEATHKSRHR